MVISTVVVQNCAPYKCQKFMKDEQTCSDLLGLRCVVVDLKSTKSCWMTLQYLTSRFPSILNKVAASTCQFVKLDDPEREREDRTYFGVLWFNISLYTRIWDHYANYKSLWTSIILADDCWPYEHSAFDCKYIAASEDSRTRLKIEFNGSSS